MTATAWLELGVGVVGDAPGWRRILTQLGIPYGDAAQDLGRWPVLVAEGVPSDAALRVVASGSAMVVSGLDDRGELLGAAHLTTLTTIGVHPDPGHLSAAPCIARLYDRPGWGVARRHEDRLVKGAHEPGVHRLVHEERFGRGWLVVSGVPLTMLITAVGDRLRRFAPGAKVTERVASVDKADLEAVLRRMVLRAFERLEIPVMHTVRYPGGADSVLIVRVDVDGDDDDDLSTMLAVADEFAVPLSIFFNGELTAPRGLVQPGTAHEVGHHGWVHNIFETFGENLDNLRRGERWLAGEMAGARRSFVGPRGLWNEALDRALAASGYDYSSEFGLSFDGLPFRTPAGVLQIPVHPYSPERAAVHASEVGSSQPTADSITRHYVRAIERQVASGQPAHLYGHPPLFGRLSAAVLPEMAATARRLRLPLLTLGGFAAWWQERENAGLRVRWHRRTGELVTAFRDGPFPVRSLRWGPGRPLSAVGSGTARMTQGEGRHMSRSNTDGDLPAAAAELANRIATGELLGATRNVVAIGEMLGEVAADDGSDLALVNRVVDYFQATRGSETRAVANGLELMTHGLGETDVAQELRRRAAWFAATVKDWNGQIAATALKTLGENVRVVAYDYSSVVAAVLRAGCSQRSWQVVVPESRTLDGGRPYVTEFAGRGLMAVVPDAALARATRDADAILLGAETLFADGSCHNTLGSLTAAVCAGHWHVPVYVATPLLKFAGEDKEPDEASGTRDFAAQYGAVPGVRTSQPENERIPGELITAYITELGILQPSEIVEAGTKSMEGLRVALMGS